MHDAAEQALLPQGEFDVPLTVADALFTANGALTIGDNESGLWGDVILVNGRPWPVMKVKRRIYRFRFLVAPSPAPTGSSSATETRSLLSRLTAG